jgi:protein tyrosine phosphatase (PTP) superfamily phosphohydrolase (DUF442 family)/cytochrome c556
MHQLRITLCFAAGCASAMVAGSACSSATGGRTASSVSQAQPASPDQPSVHALHNVHAIGDRIISGAVPEGDAAFDELAAMGVRTIVSVDGATPDVERAAARGIRYVHIPVTYAQVTDDQRLRIARAVRDLPGPVYIHCHHGKHRGPAAAAAAAVSLGIVSPEQGVAFMKEAGTAPSYQGLYACVMTATAVSIAVLDATPADFPSVQRARGIVAAMVEVDQAFDHLGDVRAAGWRVPSDHPDLVPAAEAGRLADNLRIAGEDPAARERGKDFLSKITDAVAKATALEDAIVRQAGHADLEGRYKLVQASCRDCHAKYRDVPK